MYANVTQVDCLGPGLKVPAPVTDRNCPHEKSKSAIG